jgi:hypothetical protein
MTFKEIERMSEDLFIDEGYICNKTSDEESPID